MAGAGHEMHADLTHFDSSAAASAGFAELSQEGDLYDFHTFPAAYWQRPFLPYEGADRYFVWQLDCWVISVHSFDDTHFRIAPQPIELSDGILAAGQDLLRSRCASQ